MLLGQGVCVCVCVCVCEHVQKILKYIRNISSIYK